MARTNIDHNINLFWSSHVTNSLPHFHTDLQSCATMDEGNSKVVEKLDVEDEESRHSRIRMLAFKHPT